MAHTKDKGISKKVNKYTDGGEYKDRRNRKQFIHEGIEALNQDFCAKEYLGKRISDQKIKYVR